MTSRSSLAEVCDEAIRLLEDALKKPPAELKQEVDVAERAVVALRDGLIEQRRESPGEQVQSSLDEVNVALSLIVGLEYPMGGLQRQMLDQARGVPQGVRAERLP
jgi:hypothetical protein